MCFYRYFFYGSCLHQSSILVDFCYKAQAIANHAVEGAELASKQVECTSSVEAASPTESAFSTLHHQHHRPLAEALAQQPEHQMSISSLSKHQAPQLHRSQSAPTASQLTYEIHHQQHPHTTTANMALQRQPGIRNTSDESYVLPDSADILQHLAENCRDISQVQILTDTARSYTVASVTSNKTAAQSMDFALELLGDTKQQLHRIKYGLPDPPRDTPATSLQQKMQHRHGGNEHDGGSLPGAQRAGIDLTHFPRLESPFGSTEADAATSMTRCGSYASALTLNTTCNNQPVDNDTETDFSIIMTPSPHGARSPVKESPGKHHFAQPTQSFSRRTGETLRKQQAPHTQKHTPESSPSKKSVRAKEPQLATSGRAVQRQQKRMSLPDGWVDIGSKEGSKTPVSSAPSLTKRNPTAPPSLKKKKSYMSPTKATSQRAVLPHQQEYNDTRSLRVDTSTSGPIPFPTLKMSSPSKKTCDHASPRSPTRLPRSTTASRPAVQPVLPKQPTVKNTTTRRRTSHADILQPILDRLDNQGLRKDHPPETSIPGVPTAELPARKAHRPRKWSDARSVASGSRSSRQNSNASTLLSPVIITQRLGLPHQPIDSVGSHDRMVHAAKSEPALISSAILKKQNGSLRATAQEFKPTWKPEPASQDLTTLSWRKELGNGPNEDCFGMPRDINLSGTTLSDIRRTGVGSACSGSTTWSGSPSQKADWTPMVQAGQKLRPTLTPGKKNVRWMIEDTDGHERVAHFGRAPAPSMSTDSESMQFSPRSFNSSPLKTPINAAPAWTIGPAYNRGSYYGWQGGDGKEISFAGYGPQAESNPNSPVRMQLHSMTASFDDHKENAMEEVPRVWPRSRRQWAELAGYTKIPCGNVDYVDAVEQIPGSYAGFGMCADCTVGDVR